MSDHPEQANDPHLPNQQSLDLDAKRVQVPVVTSADKKVENECFSRSFLAEKLGLPLKQLTQMMIDAGWIRHTSDGWQLSAKGEFEGGRYRQSKKFGQYIVWPSTVLDHAILIEADKKLLSASTIAKPFAIPPRLFNRLLAHNGWLKAYAKGWQITRLGQSLGGQQQEDQETGVPYVLWPKKLMDNDEFIQSIDQCFCRADHCPTTLDGRENVIKYHRLVCNWLYLLSIPFAYRKSVSSAGFKADFYLPQQAIFIDYWGEGLDPSELKQQFDKREYYQTHGIDNIEVSGADLATIDRQLSKALLGLGFDVY